MTNKERFVEYAKKHNIVKTEEVLDRRLAILPEMSRKVVETRWGLNGGKYCLRFDSLDKALGIKDSKKAYDKAMQDLENARYAELVADREEIDNWDVTCGLGLLAVATFGSYEDAPDAFRADVIRGSGVQEALEKLHSREKEVMILRFGLDGNGMKCLQEVEDIMGCTKERIRQLENKAIRKFRNPSFFSLFLSPSIIKKEQKAEEEMVAEDATEISRKSVVDIEHFSVRTINCLKMAGINTVGDILTKPEKVLEVKNFGIKTATQIIQFLESKRMENTDYKAAKEVLEEFIRKHKESLEQ